MKHAKNLFSRLGMVAALLLALPLALWAQQRNEQEAVAQARQFLMSKGIVAGSLSVADLQALPVAGDKAPRRAPSTTDGYYVVNDEASGRLVIVSADERMQTILGYSDRGALRTDNLPPAFIDLLEGYSREYAYLQQHGGRAAKAPDFTKAPLIKTQWNQYWPYNLLTPMDNGGHCVTGCGATAMAQIMKYYGYPAVGQGSMSYTPPRLSGSPTLTLDFSTVSFDWANMLNVYNYWEQENYTDAQTAAVSQLMYACGVALRMDYTENDSQSFTSDVPYSLNHFFGYSPAVQCLSRDFYTDADWHAELKAELEADRPVLYRGADVNGNGGHIFVLDGAGSDGYHINWGWGGYLDGYFMLNAMTPDEYDDFSYGHWMGTHLQPTGGERVHQWCADQVTLSIPEEGVSVGDGFSISCTNFMNMCTEANSDEKTCAAIARVGLYDADWNLVKTIGNSNNVELKANWYYYSVNFYATADAATFTDGATYYLAVYTEGAEDHVPARIRTRGGKYDYYQLTVTDGRVYKSRRVLPPTAGATGTGTLDDPYNTIAAIDCVNQLDDYQYTSLIYVKGYVANRTNNTDFQLNSKADGTGTGFVVSNCKALGNTVWMTGLDTDLKNGDEVVVCCKLCTHSSGQISNIETYLVSVNGNTEPVKGKADNPFTVAEVLPKVQALGTTSSDYFYAYVKGYVSSITEISTQYHNATFYLTDNADGSGTRFLIYRVKGLGNTDITDANLFKVGDRLVVYGKFINYHGDTPEISNDGYIVSINAEDPSGIRTVTFMADDHQPWYDLYGRRVSVLRSGQLYIHNGRKVLAP